MITMTSLEKQAIHNIAMLMMMIDGRIDVKEMNYLRKIASTLGMSEAEQKAAAGLEQKVAVTTLRSMKAANKIIAIKVFAEMALADGKVDPREDRLVNQLCDLINPEQAVVDLGGLENIKSIITPFER